VSSRPRSRRKRTPATSTGSEPTRISWTGTASRSAGGLRAPGLRTGRSRGQTTSKRRKDSEERLRDLYLDLLKRSLTGYLGADGELRANPKFTKRPSAAFRDGWPSDGWPSYVHTMVGYRRMDNLRWCIERAVEDRVPGDLIECGVWRGGASIFARAILKARGKTDRTVWVADSFEGLPPPDPERYPADEGATWHEHEALAVSLEEVKANFDAYGLLDDRVRFLRGFFHDTLPGAPIGGLAVIRLDGDMYESTMDGLSNLYPKLSPGGFLIVDDYGSVDACKEAVHDYRREHAVTEPIERIDYAGVFWRRSN